METLLKNIDQRSTSLISSQKIALTCGLLSSLWYLVINIYVPFQYKGYSMLSYTVSELSAIDAPTRKLWVTLAALYPILAAIFGGGVLKSANGNRNLQVVGSLILAYSLFNIYWPPMHMRGNTPALTDTMHIVWASITVLFMVAMMAFGAAAFGARFRIYTIFSIALHFVFGILTSLEAANIPSNGPTPFIGLWERINIFIFMLWVAVLAIIILNRKTNESEK